MQLRSSTYSLREFSESVAGLDVLQILDAITVEVHAISKQCRSLGFGNKPKKGTKARQYFDDLNVFFPMFTNTTPPNFREGFIEEAWAMLHKLSQHLVCLVALRDKTTPPT